MAQRHSVMGPRTEKKLTRGKVEFHGHFEGNLDVESYRWSEAGRKRCPLVVDSNRSKLMIVVIIRTIHLASMLT